MEPTTGDRTPRALLDSPHLASGIRKATTRLMPMLVVLYFVAFLDRTNVGFADGHIEYLTYWDLENYLEMEVNAGAREALGIED